MVHKMHQCRPRMNFPMIFPMRRMCALLPLLPRHHLLWLICLTMKIPAGAHNYIPMKVKDSNKWILLTTSLLSVICPKLKVELHNQNKICKTHPWKINFSLKRQKMIILLKDYI